MVARHNVVIPKEDGGVEMYPMKEWLRRHPEQLPPGLDTSCTSHQIRNGLRRLGWSMQQTPDEVRLIPPSGQLPSDAIDEVLGPEDEEEAADEGGSGASFGLETQLRDFIAQNIASLSINGKRLRLYVDPTGRDGVEYPTATGRIDILAIDEAGAFYVFELKRARSPDHAIGQVARYMGWVRQTIGKGLEVHGVIVSKSISDSLRYAVAVVPNVSLFEYEVEFHLRSAHQLSAP